MLHIIIKVGEKIAYGFGFGIGMGMAFKFVPINRMNGKK